MMEFIRHQLALHPSILPQDALKMSFQAAYGAEHLLQNIDKAREYFMSEFNMCGMQNSHNVMELIAPEICRVNLAEWKRLTLPPEWLFNLFALSAGSVQENADECFFEHVNKWLEFVQDPMNEQSLTFSMECFEQTLAKYYDNCGIDASVSCMQATGKPQPLHHSPEYKQAERPAYRVISGAYVRLVPVLMEIGRLGKTSGVIAIDGRAASGKTTLADGLRYVLGAEVIRMDDFFLPVELRTTARFSEVGGNIHYERFAQEVLPLLRNVSKGFEYRVFDCKTMDFAGTRSIKPSNWRVVEGTYSHHPYFGDYMDYRIFSDIDEQTQLKRIIARNGNEMAKMFAEKWIPLEERYFAKR